MGIVKIGVTGRKGERLTAEAHEGGTLMEALRDLEDGVAAVCGGNCSCGTCHVYVDAASRVQLPPASGDELGVLEAFGNYRPNSRLSCQVPVVAALEGLAVTLAPEE